MSSFLTFHVPPSELGKKPPHLQTLSSDTAAPHAGFDPLAAPFTDGFHTGGTLGTFIFLYWVKFALRKFPVVVPREGRVYRKKFSKVGATAAVAL